MEKCEECGFAEMLSAYKCCPMCGKRRPTLRLLIERIDEPITEEDWLKIEDIAWSRRTTELFLELKIANNAPISLSREHQSINKKFIDLGLPYRLLEIGLAAKEGESRYDSRLYKVRPHQ